MPTSARAAEALSPHPGIPPLINNRYQVLEKLGQGMLGVAFRARDTLEDREVAIKVIHLDALRKDMSALLRHEFAAMSRLRHPNVVEVYDFDRIEGTSMSFFSMECVHGTDFVTATRALPFDDLYPVLVQACRGLEFIHSRGILHWDLKPINLLCTQTSAGITPKLMDFHLSKENKVVAAGTVQGTLSYMAPEVVNQGIVDKRADLYSFGAILYEVVTGRTPFLVENAVAMMRAHLETEPAAPRQLRPECPEVLERIILKLLQKDPTRRYPSANQIIQDINRSTGRDFALETHRTKESYILSGRFSGRAAELSALRRAVDLWSGAGDGQRPFAGPQLAFVAGEAGSGKSRLLREFKIQCQLRGIKVFRGDCYEDRGRAYAPFLQLFRAIARAFSPDAEGLRTALPEMGRVLGYLTLAPGAAPGAPGTHAEQRMTIYDGIARLLLRVGREMPCLLWLENLQWADGETVEVLRHLRRVALQLAATRDAAAPPLPLLLCGTLRADEAAGRPIEPLLPELRADAVRREAGEHVPVLWLDLAGLAVAAVRDFLESMLGVESVADRLVERVRDATGGNPARTEQFMRLLLDEEILRHEQGTWSVDLAALARLRAGADAARPLRLELAGVTKPGREVLHALAVLDRPTPLTLLRRIVRCGDAAFYAAVVELVARQLVADELIEGEVRYQLGRVSRRRLLRTLTGRAEKQTLHQRIGVALQKTYPATPEEHAEEVVYHLERAAATAVVGRLLVRAALVAARQARHVLAFGSAVEYLEIALAAARGRKVAPRTRTEIHLALGEACDETGDPAGAMAAYRAALRGLRSEADKAEVHLRLGKTLERRGDYAGALHGFETSLAGFRRADDPEGIARACLEIAWIRGYRFCRYEEGIEFCARALRLLKGRHAWQAQVRAFTVLGAVHQTAGQWEEALRCHLRGLEIRRRENDRFELPASLNNVGLTYYLKGDFLRAREYTREGVERVEAMERPALQAVLLNTLGNCYHGLGDWGEAQRAWSRAREIVERIGDRRRIAVACSHLGLLAHQQGDPGTGIDLITRGILIARDMGLPLETREMYLMLSAVDRELGAFDAAAEDIRKAAEQPASNPHIEAITGRARGLLAGARGDLTQAESWFRKELRGIARLGFGREKADLLCDLAECFRGQGAHRRAVRLARRAERFAESLGYQEMRMRAILIRGRAEAECGGRTRGGRGAGAGDRVGAAAASPALGPIGTGPGEIQAVVRVAERMGAAWFLWEANALLARMAEAAHDRGEARRRHAEAEAALGAMAAKVPEHLREAFAASPQVQAFRAGAG